MIIVAIVGAIAVGLIVSRVSSDTSGQANVQGAGSGTQGQLFIGGSTTIYPIEEAVQAGFTAQYHITLVLSQGGSDAGMQGVISGALNIGSASSASAVNNAETDVVNNDIQGVTINPTLIGGSVVVPIENGAGANGMLTDATPNECLGISQDSLSAIYQIGSFGIDAGACATTTPNFSTLLASTGATGEDSSPSTTICTSTAAAGTYTLADGAAVAFSACATQPPPYTAVSRSDNSGTQDQMATFLNQHPAKQATSGNWAGLTESGNPGVLNYVNTHTGTIGFVDLGFAEGAASGSVCPGTHTPQTTCGVGMPQAFTSAKGGYPVGLTAAPVTMTTGAQGYIKNGGSTVAAETLSKAALKLAALVDPLTLTGLAASYPDTHAPSTGLARCFYLVTNGTPTVPEEQFLSYVTSYNQEAAFSSNGYYSQYDITSA
ncbi:MAG: hypothetical protein OK456_10490 [Thaumarchaeota archaeon]|nr:hypothetical protein [Nitrososphaerota archaeon]